MRRFPILPVLFLLAAFAASVPLVFGLLGRWHPALDSFSHFRWHLSLAVMACGLALLATRFRSHGIVAILLGGGALWTTLPVMALAPADAIAQGATSQPAYRLLHLNLRFDNTNAAAVLSLIGETKPDVITLNETSARWQQDLARLTAMYPHGAVCPSSRFTGGVAILSRRPLAPGRSLECLEDGAFAVARIDFGGRWIDVAAVHLFWPWPFKQAAQINRLTEPLQALATSALIAGDLNSATWSAAAEKIAAASAAHLVTGIGPTWLTHRLPTWLIDLVGLPIDNVFSKGDVAILAAERKRYVGSDHRPVLVTFSVSSQPGDQGSTVAASEF